MIGAGIETGFELYTDELQGAISDAEHGNFGGLAVSAGKIGVSAVSGGLSSLAVKGGISVAIKGAEAVSAGAKLSSTATTAAKIVGTALGQSANGAATKVTTNAIEGKPLDKGVGTAAAVGGTVGTLGNVAGNKIAATVGAEVGANSGTVTKIGTQVISGFAKKETSCSINSNQTC